MLMQMMRKNALNVSTMLWILCAAVLLCGDWAIGAEVKRSVPPAAPGEKVAVYFSNGDNELLFTTPPIDSPEAIDEMLDLLKNAYGVKRIYWRAPQVEQIIYKSRFRKESAHHGPWGTWLEHLFRDLGTGDHMMKAAKERDIQVWGVAALFDHGSQAYTEYPDKGYGPFPVENFIRLKYPEAVPIDRAGIRRMPGPICFEYDEARKALVQMYVDLVRDKGYDGLTFQTYVENQGIRFDDEFGFNEIIVAEYQNRHGVDIRTQPYDKDALSSLRGEFLTQFFRELRAAFKPLNVKIGIMLSPRDPEQPQRWLAFANNVLSGKVRVDWRTYVRERLVDEFFVYIDGDPFATIREVMKETAGTGIEVATLCSSGFPETVSDVAKAGVWRTISGDYEELEFGYPRFVRERELDGDDFAAKLSVLTQMGAGATPLDMERVIAATNDKSLLVRRRALRVIYQVATADRAAVTPAVIEAVKARLDDPQNIVRCSAVNTLSLIGDSASMPALFDALGKHANPMLLLLPPGPLAMLPDERTNDLLIGLRHPSAGARIVAIGAVGMGRTRPAAWPALIEAADHEDWLVRWNVAKGLEYIPTPEAQNCLLGMLDDEHPTVRSMAARVISLKLAGEADTGNSRYQTALKKLTDRFMRYTGDCADDDAEWGWRSMGGALVRLGVPGRAVVEGCLQPESDPVLAYRAWHVLYVQEDPNHPVVITEAEAEEGYRAFPAHAVYQPESAE